MKSFKWYLSRVVQFPKWAVKVDLRLSLVERQYGAFIDHTTDVQAKLDFPDIEAARWWAECRCRWILALAKTDKPVIVTLVETTDGEYRQIGRYVVRVGEITLIDHLDR